MQLLGENRFTLLEAAAKKHDIKAGERVYIGAHRRKRRGKQGRYTLPGKAYTEPQAGCQIDRRHRGKRSNRWDNSHSLIIRCMLSRPPFLLIGLIITLFSFILLTSSFFFAILNTIRARRDIHNHGIAPCML